MILESWCSVEEMGITLEMPMNCNEYNVEGRLLH